MTTLVSGSIGVCFWRSVLMHATEFQKNVSSADGASLVVLTGGERYLKAAVMNKLCLHLLGSPIEDSIGLSRFVGKDTDFRTVHDELAMVSMFSSNKLVVVDDADDFVKQFRPKLEDFANKTGRKSLLVLDVSTFPKSTKLAKIVDKTGTIIECTELTGAALTGWLVKEAKAEHKKQLTHDAAGLMVELAGTSLGLLDQELQKLTSYVGEREKITVEDVRTLVGGWKAETTWTMINAVRDGQVDVALVCLEKLLNAGEAPPKILGGVNFVFRKFADATERVCQGSQLKAALKDAGVFPRDIPSAESYLMRIRRPRALKIIGKLAEVDYGLKGGSRLTDRMQMEDLLLWLAGAIPVETL